MIETKRGLPNTCSKCGKPCEGTWFAKNEDEARSGLGLCAKCAKPPKKKAPEKKAPEKKGGKDD